MSAEVNRPIYAIARTVAYNLNLGGRRSTYERLERQDPLYPLEGTNDVFSNAFGFALSHVNLFLNHSVLPKQSAAETAFRTENLTAFGIQVREAITGRVFVDLGCGIPDMAQVPRLAAEGLGASEYIGVDSMLYQRRALRSGISFSVHYIRERILPFLAKMKRPRNGLVFYLSGLEPQQGHEQQGAKYFTTMLTEIGNITRRGDAIILGMATEGINPQNFGFRQVGQSTPNDEGKPTHRLFVKQ